MEVAGVMYRQQVRSIIYPDVKAAELKDPSGLPIVRQEVRSALASPAMVFG